MLQSSPLGPSWDSLRIPLERAAAAGNFVAVKRLFTARVKADPLPERLHLVAGSGNAGVMEEICVDVRERGSSRDNRTALHCAGFFLGVVARLELLLPPGPVLAG